MRAVDGGMTPDLASMGERAAYQPIEDYAAIGDCHGGALVARDGGIDWCCLERFDADPVFFRLLDADKGGFLATVPTLPFATRRAYVDRTNILRTELHTKHGCLVLTDFMPVGRTTRARAHDYVDLVAPGWLVRLIEVTGGEVEFTATYRPSIAFAKRAARLSPVHGGVGASNGPTLLSDMPLAIEPDRASARVRLSAGERRFLVLGRAPKPELLDRLAAVTTAFWREWIGYCRYQGPYAEAVRRSALVLKLLTYAPSGASVAAFTTSLPEEIGGERNWDYRFCWIRDASLMLQALALLGYSGEARRFYDFICRAAASGPLQVVYGIDLERRLDERTLDHLQGWRGSRPVRTGNGAYLQRQADLHGYILDGMLSFEALGGAVTNGDRRVFAALADDVAATWSRPDQGFWEMRSKPRDFVHSKAMAWATLDRACRLFGERSGWVSGRERVLAAIEREGRRDGSFRQAFGRDEVDAALLLLAPIGFPADLAGTAEAVQRELRQGDLVARYTTEDGLRGGEGAFLACSFWLVEALLRTGRGAAARELFEALLVRANDVGLYAEEVEPGTGAFLGNFPQALTHLALVASATSLVLFEQGGIAALAGAHADRARRSVGATIGWRGFVSGLRAGTPLRLFSSRRSRLAPYQG
jgi:alpha,alpha-trehalase